LGWGNNRIRAPAWNDDRQRIQGDIILISVHASWLSKPKSELLTTAH
jgi:hypothetical protein